MRNQPHMNPNETRIAGVYNIVELLGSGAMGRVYLARHETRGIDVAIKTSGRLQSRRGQGMNRVERFRREALAMAKLSHSNILSLIAFGTDERHGHYLVTELVSDGTLETLIDAPERETLLTIPAIADIVSQVAAGMASAHALNIVHRDLKPANLLLAADSEKDCGFRIKIADFGVASVGSEHVNHKLTMQGTVIGTPEYMSPEQANGETVGERADVYSLGMLLYEMVSGEPPFSGGMMEIVLSHLSAPSPKLPLEGETYAPFIALYEAMVSKSPQDRPSMMEVRDTLQRLYPPSRPAVMPLWAAATFAVGMFAALSAYFVLA